HCQRGAEARLVADGDEDVQLAPSQLGVGGLVALDAFCFEEFEGEILALLVAELGHPLLERHIVRHRSRKNADEPDAQHLGLRLRKDPRRHQRCSGECHDEIASPHVLSSPTEKLNEWAEKYSMSFAAR